MEGKYPIIVDGAPLGALEVKKNGARTQFAARCRMVEGLLRISVYGEGKEGYLGVMAPESGELTLTRTLSPLDMRAFPGRIEGVGRAGQGRTAVPAFAEKNASPAPQSPTNASPAPQPPTNASPAPQPPADASPAPQPPTDASPAPQPPTDASPAPQPPTDASPAPQPPTDASPAPQPPADVSPAPQPPADTSPAPQPPQGPCESVPPCEPEPPCQPCDTFWYASPDGALVSFDGEKSYVALPPGDRRIPTDRSGEPRIIEGREYLVFVSKNGRISL